MPPSNSFTRVVVSSTPADLLSPTFTMVHAERSFGGVWAHPNASVLVFKNNALNGTMATYHGGRVGSGWPVQLIFWGEWWLGPAGQPRQQLVIDRTRGMIDSPYFSELSQYGIAPPTWRGSLTVTEPGAPAGYSDKTGDTVLDLINDLVDDDVFPAPEDEAIAFIVLMPEGFTLGKENGEHHYTAYYEFPFSKDYYWAAWVGYLDPSTPWEPENTVRTLSHELVEMLTNPDGEGGWYPGLLEISDVGVEPDGKTPTSGTKQTAWVNGAHVQSYWSNRHQATIIPMDRDYGARLTGSTVELDRRTLETGSFRPSPSDNALCRRSPACCLEDRDYSWTIVGFDERARVRVVTDRYRDAKATWTIQGIAVQGTGPIVLNLPVQGFVGRQPVVRRDAITLEYDARDTVLELTSIGSGLNFDVTVACSVRDASIAGVPKVDLVSEPSTIVGFVGAQLALDPAFSEQRTACFKSLTARYKEQFKGAKRVPGPPQGLNYETLGQLPAYARLEQYMDAEHALRLSAMARAIESEPVSEDFERSLIEQFPILAVPDLMLPILEQQTETSSRSS